MANKIKILPEGVANQIAAGEVVDRPASVVKELVENSLDAGATRVEVEVEQGGKRLVRVNDNGEGMSREDALLCLERHATSKIRRSEDLFAISSLGFRGEALPSIASVSELCLITRERESAGGVRVETAAGVIKSVSEVGAPPGTEITIQRLFYNIPARRKFLKNVETEFGHITSLLSNLALARPDVHFSLTHNGRPFFDLPASPDLSSRLRHALGADTLSRLVPVDQIFDPLSLPGPLHVHGYISLPSYWRSSTRSLHIFVNRRSVRDRLINHAVFEAYRTLLPRGRYPLVVLFLDLPASAVDVNVHPAKHEIRFRDQTAVHEAVISALAKALKSSDREGVSVRPRSTGRLPPTDEPSPFLSGMERDEEGRKIFPASDPATGTPSPSEKSEDAESDRLRAAVAEAIRRYHEHREKDGELFPRPVREKSSPGRRPAAEADEESFRRKAEETRPGAALRFSELRVIGQAGGTYILAESADSLVVIDQHAAHERIRFERLKTAFKSRAIVRQSQLFPVTLDITYQEARRVEAHQELLLQLGIEVEPFGGNTVAVKSLPALLGPVDAGRLLLEVVDRLEEVAREDLLAEELDKIFSVMACHSVVRANRPLTGPEMETLLREMDEIAYPGHCPHGREAVVRIPFRELAKWFSR